MKWLLEAQERRLSCWEVGFGAIRDLLEQQGLVRAEEWNRVWRSRHHEQLRLSAWRERFEQVKEQILALSAGAVEKQLRRCLEKVERAWEEGNVLRVEAFLERALALDRDNLELQRLCAWDALEAGDWDRAERCIHRLLLRGETGAEVLFGQGLLAQGRGEEGRALGLFAQAVEAAPEFVEAHLALGAGWLRGNDPGKARSALFRAAALRKTPQALLILGRAERLLGQFAAAQEHLEEAARLAPDWGEVHFELGCAYGGRRWAKRALQEFSRAWELAPKNGVLLELLEKLVSSLLRPSQRAQKAMKAASRCLAVGNQRRALDLLSNALEAQPDHVGLLVRYAMVAFALGEHAEAAAAISELLAPPRPGWAQAAAACLQVALFRAERRFCEAQELALELVQSPLLWVQAMGHYELAWIAAEEGGDLETALRSAKWVHELLPEALQPQSRLLQGWLEFQAGRLESAKEHLEQAVSLSPSWTTATALAIVLLQSGKEAEVRQLSEQRVPLQLEGLPFALLWEASGWISENERIGNA